VSGVIPNGRTVLRTRPLEALIIGAWVRGLSDRDIESLVREARLGQISKTTVSQITKELRARYQAFRARGLDEVDLLVVLRRHLSADKAERRQGGRAGGLGLRRDRPACAAGRRAGSARALRGLAGDGARPGPARAAGADAGGHRRGTRADPGDGRVETTALLRLLRARDVCILLTLAQHHYLTTDLLLSPYPRATPSTNWTSNLTGGGSKQMIEFLRGL
jgi:Transposase, Mutator family